jgi:hypothetical protein
VIERILRVCSLKDADEADREDLARKSLEERISRVEAIRQKWLDEAAAERGLERVLACADSRIE